MEKIKAGLIRVLTSDDREFVNLHGKMIMNWFPEFEVHSRCIADQPEGIHDEATEERAVPKVLDLMESMERDGMSAVIVSCAGDPGLAGARERVRIPVVGAGRAAAHMACLLGDGVGIIGISETPPEAILTALGDRFISSLIPEGVVSTLDLMKPEGMAATVAAGGELVRRGADCLLLACTGLSTIGAAPVLQKELRVPVIDPVRAEAAALWMALGRNRKTALST